MPNFVTLTRAREKWGSKHQPLAARDLFGKTDVLIIERRECGYRIATLAKLIGASGSIALDALMERATGDPSVPRSAGVLVTDGP